MSGKDFNGWVVVVTGASTGLGRAIAVETAQRGAAAVVVNYASSKDEAEETGRLVEAEGAKAILVQGDVGEDADCRRIAAAAEPFGRVDAVCPGFIDTPWFGKAMPEERVQRIREGTAASVPLKVASTAEDIAGAAVFLAAPASRHVTGETLLVDAGLHLGYAPMGMR